MKPSIFIVSIAAGPAGGLRPAAKTGMVGEQCIVLKTGKTYTYIPLRHVLLIQQI